MAVVRFAHPDKIEAISMQTAVSNVTADSVAKFINVQLPLKTIDDLHALKKTMGVKTQSELIVKMVAIIKAIENAARLA